jgi:TolB-like protein
MMDKNINGVLDKPTTLLSVVLFGSFRLKHASTDEIFIPNRRARTLLAMLCLVPGEPIERELISKLLWPGRFEAQAKASLRQCLLDLGKLLGAINNELLMVTRSHVCINGKGIKSDLSCLEEALLLGQSTLAAEHLMHIGTRPLLADMNFGEAFKHWLEEHRMQTEQRLQKAITSHLSNLKPHSQDADHKLLQLAWQGRNPSAVSKIKSQPQDNKIRIAILPFQSLHAEQQPDYFTEGMVDEIITMLGQVPELMVAGRNSSFGLKDSSRSLPEIAYILGVAHLVVGSVQRQGNDVRINVRLIDGASGFEKWGNRYKGCIDDIFVLQERVAGAVTNELSNVLGVKLQAPKIHKMTNSQEAYDLYMHGRALTKRMVGEGILATAIDLLEQSLALDPQFAEGWATLAEANAYVTIFTPCLDKVSIIARMAECANKALELSPQHGLAMVMLGVYKWTQNDPLGALELAFAAHKLQPNNPAVTARLGSFLCYCGLTKQALPYIASGVQQDPLDGRHLIHLSSALLNSGDITGARRVGEKIAALGFPSLWLAVATAAAGEHELAVKQYSQTRLIMNSLMSVPSSAKSMTEQELDAYWDTCSKGICSGKEQDQQKYCQLLDYMYATLPDKYDMAIVLPSIWLGYAPMLFKTVGQQITPPNMACLMSLWADIDPIRQVRTHPDFIAFATKIGLVAAWEKYGWPDLLPAPNDVK